MTRMQIGRERSLLKLLNDLQIGLHGGQHKFLQSDSRKPEHETNALCRSHFTVMVTVTSHQQGLHRRYSIVQLRQNHTY